MYLMLLMSVPRSPAVRISNAKPQVVRWKSSHGPLGNMIAAWYENTYLHTKNTATKRKFGTSDVTSASPMKMHEPTEAELSPTQVTERGKASKSPRKGIKELVRMLWSNFVPDPTFDNAIAGLKQHDKQFSIDSVAGQDGHITAAITGAAM